MNNLAINKAKETIRKNAFADFGQQAAALRQLLQQLPILPSESEILKPDGQPGDLETTMTRLEMNWAAYNPPNSHEGAVSVVIGDEVDVLTAVFHAEVWGMSSEQSRLAVARVDANAYLFWSWRG